MATINYERKELVDIWCVDIKILEQYLPENEYNELKAKEQVA
jgi:uncharacterized protein YqeY